MVNRLPSAWYVCWSPLPQQRLQFVGFKVNGKAFTNLQAAEISHTDDATVAFMTPAELSSVFKGMFSLDQWTEHTHSSLGGGGGVVQMEACVVGSREGQGGGKGGEGKGGEGERRGNMVGFFFFSFFPPLASSCWSRTERETQDNICNKWYWDLFPCLFPTHELLSSQWKQSVTFQLLYMCACGLAYLNATFTHGLNLITHELVWGKTTLSLMFPVLLSPWNWMKATETGKKV